MTVEYPLKPLPWSHSSLTTYVGCPKKYYHLKVSKDFEDSPNEASLWGNRVHEALEFRLRDKTPLPEEYSEYEEYAKAIEVVAGEMLVEKELAITKDLKPCAMDDPDAWCRGIVDVLHINGPVARVLDHKTGKRKPDSKQLALFALLVFYHYPEVHVCKTGFMWLKTKEKDVAVYHRNDIPELWKLFIPDLTQYAKSFAGGIWTPRTSGLCKNYCPVASCDFNGKNR